MAERVTSNVIYTEDFDKEAFTEVTYLSTLFHAQETSSCVDVLQNSMHVLSSTNFGFAIYVKRVAL
jgi:hypothetical protein